MSKIAVIYHSVDADGWMSAAIVKHWFETDKTEIQPNVFLYRKDVESLTFIGYNYGQPIPDLSEYDTIIMCDISFPLINMLEIADRLMDTKTLETDFIWIDHHISAIKSNISVEADGIRNTQFAACELTWKFFFPNEPMPEIVRLLGLYDSFRHKGTDEETKVLEFQYGARQLIINYEEAYTYLSKHIEAEKGAMLSQEISIPGIWNKGKAIYQYLCTEAKQVYSTGFEIEFIIANNKSCLNDIATVNHHKFICINKERFNPINFGIDYHKDGYDGCACFHYANGMWNFSIYNDNGLVDCSVIAKQYSGGGHRGASGFKLHNEQFNNLISSGELCKTHKYKYGEYIFRQISN